jgi:hypothetical protein
VYPDDDELEPGEFERFVVFLLFGLAMADVIGHPDGAREMVEAIGA